ncbi:unnamed protein product [Meloidogyne enterolobii]|uniref:Uncharacterized protein n=1 Tax=Meloidogyne enterolobii TaxID=390850 RepID=A0ACB0ZMT5_MELEN
MRKKCKNEGKKMKKNWIGRIIDSLTGRRRFLHINVVEIGYMRSRKVVRGP